MAGVVKYPDLRFLFMRGLIEHEREQRCHHYLKSAAECTSRAIVSLELTDEPIKSVTQARMLEGIGGETCTRLKKIEKERMYSCLRPLGGRFVSSAGGILVGLLDATEEMIHNGHSAEKNLLVPEENVRRRAARLTEETFSEGQTEFCKAWWRLEVLIKRGYIRRRSYKKSPVLQLLPLGRDVALRLRKQSGLMSTVPVRPSTDLTEPLHLEDSMTVKPRVNKGKILQQSERTSIPCFSDMELIRNEETEEHSQGAQLQDALYTNDTGLDGIVMLVDRREMGGEQWGLPELCRLLNDNGICYKTSHLSAGDYCWVWRIDGREIILPCLVERKRADDIARTLKEGRFWSQVNKMKEWKEDFTKQGMDCTLHYVLERKPEEFMVKCADGCQGIIQCGNPTLTQVKMVIEDLKRHPELLVKETDDLNITVILLASLTAELAERAKKGDFDKLIHHELSGWEESKGQSTSTVGENKQEVSVDADIVTDSEDVVAVSDDEDLRLAIENSKQEMCKAKELLGSSLNDSDKVKDSYSRCANRNSVVNDLSDEDEELARVLEISKHETHIRNTDTASITHRIESERWKHDIPLVQYHCSAGGSLNYPAKNKNASVSETSGYRPKMNTHKVPKTVSDFKFMDCDKTCTSDSHKSFTSTAESHHGLMSNLLEQGVAQDDNNPLYIDSPSPLKSCSKRRYYKKDLRILADEKNIEKSYIIDSESLVRKKTKNVTLNFEPAKEFVETNVVKVSCSVKEGDERLKHNVRKRKVNSMGRGELCCKGSFGLGYTGCNLNINDRMKSYGSIGKVSNTGKTGEKRCETVGSEEQAEDSVDYDSGEDLFSDQGCEKNGNVNGDCSCQVLNSSPHKETRLSRTTVTLKSKTCTGESFHGTAGNDCTSETYPVKTGQSGTSLLNTGTSLLNSDHSSSEESLPDIGLDLKPSSKASANVVSLYSTRFADHVSSDIKLRQSRNDSGYDSETIPGTFDKETNDKVKLVMSVLPHVSRKEARHVLERCNLNVDMCIAELLDKSSM